jgi:hypothetical protein
MALKLLSCGHIHETTYLSGKASLRRNRASILLSNADAEEFDRNC